MTLLVAPVVEGQTEVQCVERLLQRVWADLPGAPGRLQVLTPTRGPRDQLGNPDRPELAAKVALAATKLTQPLRRTPSARGAVLVLFDADDDCPAQLGPRLLAAARGGVPPELLVACVLAKRMLENWIVAGASTLGTDHGLPDPIPPRSNFDELNGEAWLDAQLRAVNPARKYKKTADAVGFVQKMSLAECRANSDSFAKLCRELARFAAPPADPAQAPPADADAEAPPT